MHTSYVADTLVTSVLLLRQKIACQVTGLLSDRVQAGAKHMHEQHVHSVLEHLSKDANVFVCALTPSPHCSYLRQRLMVCMPKAVYKT